MFSFEKNKDGVGILTINQTGSVNVIQDEFINTFEETLKKIFSHKEVKGLIVTSGKKEFMNGGDLGFLRKVKTIDESLNFISKFHSALRFLETQGRPVVAALNGTALGGGLELALACHYRVCFKDPKIQIGLPEVTIGLLPGGGGTQRLPRLMGIQPSLELLTLGTKLDPEKALKVGIVHELADTQQELLSQAQNWILKNPAAHQPWDDKKFKIPGGGVQSPGAYQVFAASNGMIAEKTYHNYPAPEAILSCVYEGLQVPFDAGLKIEARYFAKLLVGPVAKNMINTLFFGIQECNKGSGRPKDVPPMPTKKLGVLGAGMMGSAIAYVAAKAGISVVLKDVSAEVLEKGKSYSAKICDGLIAKGRMTEAEKNALLGLINLSTESTAVKDCDLVIETVIEDRKIKAQVTKESEKVMSATSTMASNTSTLPITGLAEASVRPEKFIGLHFFSPVDKMPLVEIILGKKTEKEAIAQCIDFVRQIKKTPIVVSDGRGFYTSRVFMTYVSEGTALLNEGVSPALIENAGRMVGMPVGPLAVADEVSIDLMWHILSQTVADLGIDKVDQVSYDVSKKFVEELKRKGRKSGAGFYEYPAGGKKFLWPKLTEIFHQNPKAVTLDEVKERLLTIQALESARCLEEGILHDVRDGDVGSILGWGFPAYTGGTLSYIDMIGIKKFVERCESFTKKFGPRFAPSAWLKERASKGQRFSES